MKCDNCAWKWVKGDTEIYLCKLCGYPTPVVGMMVGSTNECPKYLIESKENHKVVVEQWKETQDKWKQRRLAEVI